MLSGYHPFLTRAAFATGGADATVLVVFGAVTGW